MNDFEPLKANFPRVSIIILNWNGWRDTIECLESVFRIDYPNYQVIVVDNGSTDGSVEKIKAWVVGEANNELNPPSFFENFFLTYLAKPIQLIEIQENEIQEKNNLNNSFANMLILLESNKNLGFSGGINLAFKHVSSLDSSDYLWFLNNDTVVHRDALKLMLHQYEKQTKIGIVGSIICYFDFPEKVWFRGGKVNYCLGGGFHIGKNKMLLDENLSENNFVECDFITGCSMLIRKEIFGDLCGFDDKFFLNYEDIDFCWKARKEGWVIGFVDYPLVFHKVSISQVRYNGFLVYHVNRSRLIWIRKTMLDDKRLIIGLMAFLFSRLVIILKLILRGESRDALGIIKGIIDGFKVPNNT